MSNMDLALDFTDKHEGSIYKRVNNGKQYYFNGILICRDDLYYEMICVDDKSDRILLSFAVDIECLFELVEGC